MDTSDNVRTVQGDDTGGGASASDVPLDLAKEREAFVRTFLRKGVEYTELLLTENNDLREELQASLRENAQLRAQVASDDAIRDLLKTVDRLETERSEILGRSSELEQAEREVALRQQSAEQDLSDLANLYIATYQLHASFSPRRVVRHLRDLSGQLVGADGFVIYLVDKASSQAIPIAFEGLDEKDVASIPLGSGPVGEACLTGLRFVRETNLHEVREQPVAIIPMLVEGRTIGAIEIRTVLEQKTAWASLDHELFELVANQAGMAMIAANQYEDQSGGPAEALVGFAEKQQK